MVAEIATWGVMILSKDEAHIDEFNESEFGKVFAHCGTSVDLASTPCFVDFVGDSLAQVECTYIFEKSLISLQRL